MMSDCRAGISNALIRPPNSASETTHAMLMLPDATISQNADACTASSVCATITSLSLSYRSAITPPRSENSATGSAPDAATRPTMNGSLLSWSASHPCATICIHVPISETVCPTQKRRKFRCR